MHALRVDKAGQFGQIRDIGMATANGQRVLEGDIHDPVAILDIEDNRVAPQFTPAPDNPQAMLAAGHYASQIDSPDFEVAGHRNRLLNDGGVQNAGDDDILP